MTIPSPMRSLRRSTRPRSCCRCPEAVAFSSSSTDGPALPPPRTFTGSAEDRALLLSTCIRRRHRWPPPPPTASTASTALTSSRARRHIAGGDGLGRHGGLPPASHHAAVAALHGHPTRITLCGTPSEPLPGAAIHPPRSSPTPALPPASLCRAVVGIPVARQLRHMPILRGGGAGAAGRGPRSGLRHRVRRGGGRGKAGRRNECAVERH